MSSRSCWMSVLITPNACLRLWISQLEPAIVANIYLNICVPTLVGGGGGACDISTSSATCPGPTSCWLRCLFSFFFWCFSLALSWASNAVRLMKGLSFSGASPDGMVIPAVLQIPLIKFEKVSEQCLSFYVPNVRIWLYMNVARSIFCPRTRW